jgi:GNAT superfamily N-acetyltransferase
MSGIDDRQPARSLPTGIEIRPLGLDDFPAVRYLHLKVLRAHTVDALTEAEIAAFANLVHSPAYTDLLREENEIFSAWLAGELVGTAAWRINADDGMSARIGFVFARHSGFGIGSRLVAEAEARALTWGFERLTSFTTLNAVSFFQRLGYAVVSHGIKVLSPECALPVAFLAKRLAPQGQRSKTSPRAH